MSLVTEIGDLGGLDQPGWHIALVSPRARGVPQTGWPTPDGSVLLSDYSTAGQVLRIAADGTVLWRKGRTARRS